MRCRCGLSCCALSLVLVLGLPGVAAARPPAGTPDSSRSSTPKPGSPAASKLARKHFDKALERYRKGAYREAIAELNKAIALDPHSKDLVYNRGLVYEKLGQIDDAIHEFEHYLQLEHDPEERKRARAIITRLKGARHEVETAHPESGQPGATSAPSAAGQPNAASPPSEQSPSSEPGEETPPRESPPGSAQPLAVGSTGVAHRGRLDQWVYVAGGVATAAVLVGSIFGIRALATEPGVNASTSSSKSYSQMQDDQSRAHSYAVVADVSFAVGILSGAAAGALYFMRAPAAADTARTTAALPSRPLPAPGFSWGMRF